MTAGIYSLYWEEAEDKVYVGQSATIEYRLKAHHKLLEKRNHYNINLQSMYNVFGPPKSVILEECTPDTMDSREIHWINEFDSLNTGYNMVSGGVCGRGLNHSQSKYSKATLLRIFSLLYRTTLPYEKVAEKCKVNTFLVHNIVLGTHHLWLQEEYPNQFDKMILSKELRRKSNRKTAANLGIKYPPIVSPTGEVFYEIGNISEFCRQHEGLNANLESARSAIAKVLKSKKDSYKGWKLLT